MNLTETFVRSKKTLTDRLLENVSSYDIFCHFIGYDLDVGKVILSPIRKDNRPTFILFIPEDLDDVFFKDFAWVGGTVFKFVKLFALYTEQLHLRTRKQVIKYIDTEMGIGLFVGTDRITQRRRQLNTAFYASKRVIRFKSRDFTEKDIKYWKSYHINKKTLIKYKVKSVHKLLNEVKEVVYTVSRNTLTFVYIIYNKVKLYSPESLDFKWRNTCPAHYLQGIEQILATKSGNSKLIITKSLKDVMVFDTFIGDKYDVLAPHSENNLFTPSRLDWMYKNYTEIIIIYDYDLAGVIGVNRLRKLNPSKFRYVFVSTKRIRINGKITTIDKDISDFAYGRSVKEVSNKLQHMGL